MKLHERTPDAVVYFLSGSLPASATLHIKQLTLFSMITRLPHNILHKIAKYILTTSSDSSKSWFFHIRSLTFQYGLPHPLVLLENPQSKYSFKKLVSSKVMDFWEQKLRLSSIPLKSLRYFHPNFMSLKTPHPLWTSCGDNSFEISKAIIQAKFLSGRYRTDSLLSHFEESVNPQCSLCKQQVTGSLEHLLVLCDSLLQCRSKQFESLEKCSKSSEVSKKIINETYNKSITHFVQLLVDCTTMPLVLEAKKIEPNILNEILKFARTWCFNVHINRMKLLGRWKSNS